MARKTNDWNFYIMHSVQALTADVQRDMMNCLKNDEVVDVVKERMLQRLKSAVKEIEMLKLTHD